MFNWSITRWWAGYWSPVEDMRLNTTPTQQVLSIQIICRRPVFSELVQVGTGWVLSPPVMSVLWRKVCIGAGTEINDVPQKPVEELGCCFEMCRLALFWTCRILSSYCPFLYFFSFPQLLICFYTIPSWLRFSSIIKPFALAYSTVKLLLHIIWVTWGRKHRQLM